MRVERVYDLAAWLLGTTPAAVRATVATGRTIEQVPPQETEVVLAYLTAWPNATGRTVLHADPYGYDQPGARRASFRRVSRPLPADAMDPNAAPPETEDNPL